jgi:hypothetical protein
MTTMPVFIRMLDGDGHFHRAESEPIRDNRRPLSSHRNSDFHHPRNSADLGRRWFHPEKNS